jgi:hypothetical protein
MAGNVSLFKTNPELVEEVAKKLAMGIPQALISRAYGVPETTINGWKKRKDFRRILGSKTVALGTKQIGKILDSTHYKSAQIWLERHPDFKEQWAMPDSAEGGVAGMLDSLAGLARAIAGPARQPREIKGKVQQPELEGEVVDLEVQPVGNSVGNEDDDV